MRDDYDRNGTRVGLQPVDYGVFVIACLAIAVLIAMC